jgi:hypothetical protein
MAIISCQVRYRGSVTGSIAISQRYWREALKQAWNKVGWYLFERFVEKHFTKAGADEYRNSNESVTSATVYAARSGEDQSGKAFWRSYNGRKQKKLGHQLALVFSGATRDGAKRATIYATSNGVRVAMPGLVHLNQYKPPVKKYGPHAGEPSLDLRSDVLAVSKREVETLAEIHRQHILGRFNEEWLDEHIVDIKP